MLIQHVTQALQVGDQLDRGDNEIQILYFLERLQKEAAAAGGALHILNGNHETMNVGGRFRYATQPGRLDFLRWQLLQSMGEGLKVCLSIQSQHPDICCLGLHCMFSCCLLYCYKEACKVSSRIFCSAITLLAWPHGHMELSYLFHSATFNRSDHQSCCSLVANTFWSSSCAQGIDQGPSLVC